MSHGLLANGRSGDFYVEVEEEIATQKHTLLIEHPSLRDNQIQIPLTAATKDIDDLIAALKQVRDEL